MKLFLPRSDPQLEEEAKKKRAEKSGKVLHVNTKDSKDKKQGNKSDKKKSEDNRAHEKVRLQFLSTETSSLIVYLYLSGNSFLEILSHIIIKADY